MLIGVLSDPHANFPAVERVLADVDEVRPDSVICLGDFVGYGAEPNEVVEALRNRCESCLIGNHDLAALGRLDLDTFNEYAAEAARWTENQMSAPTRTFLEPLESRSDYNGILLAHASPRHPVWEYVLDSESAAANFDAEEFEIAMVGHTHIPAVFSLDEGRVRGRRIIVRDTTSSNELPSGGRYILNPGGIGQPRDGDPRASWGTWDTERRIFTIRRLEYPVGRAQSSIIEAGLPGLLAERLAEGW